MAPYDECYKIEEMKKLNISVLEYGVKLMEKIQPYYKSLRNCPIYWKLIGDNSLTIVGGVFAVIVLIVVAICIKGTDKNKIRRTHTEAHRF